MTTTRCVGHRSPSLLLLCVGCVWRARPCLHVVSLREASFTLCLCAFFIRLSGFILPFRCNAGSDGEPVGASGSGGRVLGAGELRGVLLLFVCCCSFPSIALVVTLSLLLCSGAAMSGSHSLTKLASWCVPCDHRPPRQVAAVLARLRVD